MAGDNSYADVTFSEDVYGDNAHSTAIGGSDLDLDMGTNTTGVIDSWTISPTHAPGSDTLVIAIIWSTDPETGDEVILRVTGANRIFDTAGNDMPSSTSGSGNAKSLSLNLPYTVSVTIVQNEPKQASPVTSSWYGTTYRPSTILKSKESQDQKITLHRASPATLYTGKQNTQSVSKGKPVDTSEFTLYSLKTESAPTSQGAASTAFKSEQAAPDASTEEGALYSSIKPIDLPVGTPEAVQGESSGATNLSAADTSATKLTPADLPKQHLPIFPIWIVAVITILGTAAFWAGSRIFKNVGGRDGSKSL